MPVVNLGTHVPGYRADTPDYMATSPGALGEAETDAARPDFTEALSAVFSQENQIASAVTHEAYSVPDTPEPGFNAWERIKGTDRERFWENYLQVNNQAQFDAVSRDIDADLEARSIIEATPLWQAIPMTMAAGLLDPTIIAPGGAFVKSARGGVSVARTAAATAMAGGMAMAAQETGLQATQQIRPGEESFVNIGAGILLSSLLGAGGARLLNRGERLQADEMLRREVADFKADTTPAPGPVGAAIGAERTVTTPSLDSLSIAGRAAGKTAKTAAFLNPGQRLAQSPSNVSRDTAYNLYEMTQHLRGEDDGLASPTAVETLRKEWNAGLMKAVQVQRDAFKEYRKRVGSAGLSRSDFAKQIGRAMRRGDDDAIPEVASAAKAWRADVFDPLKNAAIEAKLLPENVSVTEAASYFSRVYNRRMLVAQEGRFKNIVTGWLNEMAPRWIERLERQQAKSISDIEKAGLDARNAADEIAKIRQETEAVLMEMQDGTWTREVADEVFNKLTGRGGADIPVFGVKVAARGPLKERTFHIPDELIEDFLESDVDFVGRRYQRIMSADVELQRKFGSVTLDNQFKSIETDYAKLRESAASKITDERKLEKELNRLDKAEKADKRDLQGIVDLLRGTYDRQNWENNFGRIARLSNMFNYIRAMGQVVLSSLPEAFRTAMVHGLGPSMKTLSKINTKGFKMSVGEARLAGNIGERVLSHRLATLAEINDFYSASSPAERFVSNMVEVASSWNGIRLWTDFAKMVASVAVQDRVLKSAVNFAKATKANRRLLAHLGIDETMAGRIAKQFDEHGEIADGVHVANTDKWTDADAVRQYRAAINKDVDTQVVTKSVADIPLFANTPLGRVLFQFNTFNLASHQRVLLRGLQEGPTRFVGSVVSMTTMGMFVTYLRSVAGNQDVPDFAENPGWWIGEGLDYSGIFMVPMQTANAFEKLTGFNPVKAPIRVLDKGDAQSSRIYNRNAASLLGPSLGLVQDIGGVVGTPFTLAAGKEWSQGQKNALERLLPYNSYYGMRQMMRYFVNERD